MGQKISNYGWLARVGAAVALAPADYIARAHDANGMVRLVQLQVELKNEPEANLVRAIQHATNNNPYSQVLMNYDEEGSWLSFECLDRHASCRISLR